MAKEKKATDGQVKVRAILENLSQDEQRLLSAVLNAEREKLYMQKPRGINDDLWRVLTENIR
jgi:hypothetical protein